METPLQIGYPIALFYVSAFIGAALILFRPRWAFAFVVFGLAMRNYIFAVFTRTQFLGEFLNLNDLFLWMGFVAMLRITWSEQKIWAPKILLAIIAILVLGDFQSLFLYGLTKIVIRPLWATCVFPIMFLVGANIVKNTQDARLFIWSLFLGSVVAALQHLVFIEGRFLSFSANLDPAMVMTGMGIRSVDFMYSGGVFLVIGALFLDVRRILGKLYLFIFWGIGLSLISVSYILSFTRTIWAGTVMTVVAMVVLLLRERQEIFSRLRYAIPIILLALVVFKVASHFIIAGVNIEHLIDERADFVRYEEDFDAAYGTREAGMKTELDMWKNGTIIWGVGASYPPRIDQESVNIANLGALNHVAFSAYLAHFGIIGLLTYGLFLPYFTIKIGRRYLFSHKYDYGGLVAITAIALAFFNLFTIVSGHHYLVPIGQVQGLIYGALWGVSRNLKVIRKNVAPSLTDRFRNQLLVRQAQQITGR